MQAHLDQGGDETDQPYLTAKGEKEAAEGRVTELQNHLNEVQ